MKRSCVPHGSLTNKASVVNYRRDVIEPVTGGMRITAAVYAFLSSKHTDTKMRLLSNEAPTCQTVVA
jgi:hypothetical protein